MLSPKVSFQFNLINPQLELGGSYSMNKADIMQLAVLALDIEKLHSKAEISDDNGSYDLFEAVKDLNEKVKEIRKIKNKNLDKRGKLFYNECSTKG